MLFSSHITTDLERIADQIAYLHHGQLLFQKDKDVLLEELADDSPVVPDNRPRQRVVRLR